MAIPLIMTVLGPDRPGLVDVVASAVAEHGGNWLDSRMCHLGGHFAGIVRVEVPGEREHALRQQIQSLSMRGLQVTVARDEAAGAAGPRRTMVLDLVGNDRPGIVQQISHILAVHGVNVEELHTERTSAPWSGEPLFEARLRIEIPESCELPKLRADLEKIAAELMVDFTLGLKP
ncbi:MAG: ACT domain-containing protein [Candidatus Methylacidiphilales bacterium]|nr:ACT domain-containing protein [Candidatus Methylacidiphilales bacterium]